MTGRACFSVFVALLVVEASVLGSAIAALPDNCSHFTPLSKEESAIEILELFDDLPEGFAIVICNTPSGRDSIQLLSPVSNRDGVSYYQFAYYTVPEDRSIAEISAEEILQQGVDFRGTMMALDENANLTHHDEAFIGADFVSVGAFKRFYPTWAKIFENPKRRDLHPDLSRLNAEGIKTYNDLMGAVSGLNEWKIYALELTPPDSDLSPMYVVEVAAGGRPWSVYFDLIDDKVTALGVGVGDF